MRYMNPSLKAIIIYVLNRLRLASKASSGVSKILSAAWLLLAMSLGMNALAQEKSAPPMSASEYGEKRQKLNQIEVKIKAKKEDIERLIVAKNKTEDAQQKHSYMEQMVSIHESMKQDIVKYNQLRTEVRYRFPEKNDVTKRRYIELREKSLEQIEKEIGLDQMLTRARQHMEDKYRPFIEAHEAELLKEKLQLHKEAIGSHDQDTALKEEVRQPAAESSSGTKKKTRFQLVR